MYSREPGLENSSKLPYGLRERHRLECHVGKIRNAIKTLAAIAGAEDGLDVAEKVAPTMTQNAHVVPLQDAPGDAPEDALEQPVLQPLQDMEPSPCEEGKRIERIRSKRKANDSPFLNELIEVVEYALALPPHASKQKVCREKFPHILRSNVLSKWISKYFLYKLHEMKPEVSKRLKAIPNWWIEEKGIDAPTRARQTVVGIPKPVAQLVDQAQSEKTMGHTQATKRADAAQGSAILCRSITAAVAAYNETLAEETEAIEKQNAEAWTEFKESLGLVLREDGGEGDDGGNAEGLQKRKPSRGQIKELGGHVKRLREKVKRVPKPLTKWKPNHMTACRFNRHFGNYRRRTNTAGNFLSYDDPRMAYARSLIRDTVKEHSIHWGLVLKLGGIYNYRIQ